ncbi:UNVERIFIED_CONTAM: hypothetical protein GTU68_008051 [Idotea baltica]|nr:hypothetical protein [Idotea baltica]
MQLNHLNVLNAVISVVKKVL